MKEKHVSQQLQEEVVKLESDHNQCRQCGNVGMRLRFANVFEQRFAKFTCNNCGTEYGHQMPEKNKFWDRLRNSTESTERLKPLTEKDFIKAWNDLRKIV